MAQLRHILFVLSVALVSCVWAQESANPVSEEHRYQFVLHSDITGYQEKVLIQRITGLEPGMHINIDREERLMKVLTYQPIDPQDVIDLAAQNSISIGNRRRLVEASGSETPNE